MSIIMSRMLDTRKIFMIGLSFILGMSVEAVPELYRGSPAHLEPVFGSALALAAISALILNLILRIGIASKVVLELAAGLHSGNEIYGFFEKMGSAWGPDGRSFIVPWLQSMSSTRLLQVWASPREGCSLR